MSATVVFTDFFKEPQCSPLGTTTQIWLAVRNAATHEEASREWGPFLNSRSSNRPCTSTPSITDDDNGMRSSLIEASGTLVRLWHLADTGTAFFRKNRRPFRVQTTDHDSLTFDLEPKRVREFFEIAAPVICGDLAVG